MNWWDFPLNLIAGQDPAIVFWVSLVASWLLTPGLMIIIAWLFENRRLPLISPNQFRGFFPGDLFLGLMVALLMAYATQLPAGDSWYTSWTLWGRIIVLVGAIGVARGLTRWELKEGVYSREQIFSPTKLYHNGLLYVGYGYLIVSSLIHILLGAPSWWLLLLILPGIAWVVCNLVDGRPRYKGDEPLKRKAMYSHVPDWKPIWRS